MLIFKQLPTLQYNRRDGINLVTRAAIREDVLSKYEVYYPYKIKDGERPDTIASDYYNAATFDWLVLMCNNITNYYSQWPKTDRSFQLYMADKYGNVNATMQEIHHYKYDLEEASVRRITYNITPATYAEMTVDERYGWSPVYTYDWEVDLNEAKRDIRLISNVYLNQIQSELAVLFK